MPAPPPPVAALARLARWLGVGGAVAPSVRAARGRARDLTTPAPSAPAPTPPAVVARTPDDVRTAVLRDALARREAARDPGDAALLDRLLHALGSETLALPVFPQVAHELDRLLRSGDAPVREVARLVQREPDLVRRVWQAAASAEYARGVTSLDHALARIGFDAAWRIAMQTCFASPLFRVPGHARTLEELRVRGTATGEVAGALSDEPRGAPYLAGLLHGAGSLVVLQAAQPPRGGLAPRPDTVRALAQAWQPPLGVLVAHTWGLSPTVGAAIGALPAPDTAPREAQACAWLVRAAWLSVRAALAGVTDPAGSPLALLAAEGPLHLDPHHALALASDAVGRARRS